MADATLLSNGRFHTMVTAAGSGYSHWQDIAVTRWREDAALDETGTFLFIRDDESGQVWSATHACGAQGTAVAFENGVLTLAQREHDLGVAVSVAVGADDDVELRRVRIENHAPQRRHLSLTSYAEIVLAPAATDSAHPAFSKLFVETAIDASLGAIFASRRPSETGEARRWFFHSARAPTGASGVSYETDRLRFIGRGRGLAEAQALHDAAPLSAHAGAVLDAIASIRVPLVLEAGAACTIDWFAGIAASKAEAEAAARRCRHDGAADRLLESAGRYREATLRRLGASAAEGRLYERLAGALLIANAALRGDAATIARNERGQSSLWGFGISGDVPVVLAEIAGAGQFESELELVQHLVRAQAFWKAHGIATELMIVGAERPATPALLAAVQALLAAGPGAAEVGRPGGIFVRDDAELDDGDRTLLRSVARIAASGSWQGLIERLAQGDSPTPTRPFVEAARGAAATARGAPDLVADNGHGGFAPDLREYVIRTTAAEPTPAPWTNVIANAEFGTLISESGSASTWSENAHEFRLTPWSNDPVSDAAAEAFYLRDETSGRVWSPTLLPTRSSGDFIARHGFGYSVFEHEEDGIASTLRVHVAIDAPVKFSALTLRNRSTEARRLTVTGYVEWVLGDERGKTLLQVVTELDAETGVIYARNGYRTDFAGRTAFFDVDIDDDIDGGERRADAEPVNRTRSATGDRADFFGAGRSRAAPAALAQARLGGRFGASLDPCAALRIGVDLAPGQAREVTFRLGAGKSPAEARELACRWRGRAAAHAAFAAVDAHWRRTLGVVSVRTPDPAVNALANGWLLYQVMASRLWGRTAFYQSSGAYGFRDQLQDVMALVHCEPQLVREHLLRAASRQFIEGDVQHWWHPPTGKGVRTRCSDDYLWLPLVTSRYVAVTGDAGVLDATCQFLESRPLHDGEVSNYELPKVAAEDGSLYEHCVRAIRHGLRYGEHGLPLMGAGDWNDGMNLVGAGGKGESVWLAFFLIAVLKRFAPLARGRGDVAFAERCEQEAQGLQGRIEATAWDGDWYQRAWFDDGAPLGAAINAECRIDSIAQSWSVLSGAAPDARARVAMASVHRQLVDTEARLVRLLDPPFDTSKPSPGYIQGYVTGVRENGGQYTHAAVWAALAFASLGDGERAWQLFGLLAPMHHGASAADIETYQVEPYVVAGDVYASKQHVGRGGWSWYTGSAGWMYQLLVESLLGLERRGAQLRVRPLLPKAWPGFEIDYRFGASTYRVVCRGAAPGEAARVSIDGVESADGWFGLVDDGAVHEVAVSVLRDAARAGLNNPYENGETQCNSQ